MLCWLKVVITFQILIHVIRTCKVRSARHSKDAKTNAMGDDAVELTESNILLMSPTGTGNRFMLYLIFHCGSNKSCKYGFV